MNKLVSIHHDIDKIQKQYSTLGATLKQDFLKYSINQIGKKARTETVKTISKTLGIPQWKVRGTNTASRQAKGLLTEKPATNYDMSYSLVVNSRFLHASEEYFKPKQTKTGVTTKYYDHRHKFTGGFLKRGKGSNKMIAFKRTTKDRYPIKPIFAFNPATEFMKARISSEIIAKFLPQIVERYDKKLSQYLNRYSKK